MLKQNGATALFGAVLLATAGFAPGVGAEETNSDGEDEEAEVVEHEVDEDETVGTVALDHGVNPVDLMEWNDLETVHELEAGDELEVRFDEELPSTDDPQPVVHVVSRGDTFGGVAQRHGVTTSQLQSWNPNVDPRRMQPGERLHLNIPGPEEGSVSWGRASQGRLYNGVQMQDSPGLDVRTPSRSYGTQNTVNLLQAAGADVKARWPDAPELVVGSLSLRGGGPISPHRSHQSGRDADLSYYHRGNVELEDFRDMTPEKFDAVKNWHFFMTLIETGEVEYIFVDYELQEILYEYALSIGYDEQDLDELIQYPRSPHSNRGIIRHSSGHDNHFHVRFKCTEQDQNCR